MPPPVVMLSNGRYAYKVQCPWKGKGERLLFAYKFCSTEAYKTYQEQQEPDEPPKSDKSDSEQSDAPEEPDSE